MTATITAIASGPDPERIPPRAPRAPRRRDPVSAAWVRKYRTVAALNPHMTGEDLATTTEKHFGGAA